MSVATSEGRNCPATNIDAPKALNAPARVGKPGTKSMPTRFQVSREDHSNESGWVPIGKFGSLSKAEAFAGQQERGKFLYSNNNPNRMYHLVEAV